MKAQVLMLRQDDPAKCTAAKLAKFGLAEQVRRCSRSSIVLDPFSDITLSREDNSAADSVCAIDCSWERIGETKRLFRLASQGLGRRLPALLAANPVNYAKLNKLSSAEALAGAVYILGDRDQAAAIMNKFKWGHTFLELNAEPLAEYSQASRSEIESLELQYFPKPSG
ncbi:MAG: DUF367 family protein [Nitrososphaera sp.]